MKKTTRLITSMLVPLAVAGTCLATPAFALPQGMSGFGAQADAVVEEVLDTVSTTEGMNAATVAGVTVQFPSDYVVEEEEGDVFAYNSSNTAGIAVYDFSSAEIPAGSNLEDVFAEVVADVDTEGNCQFAGVEELGDGVVAYGYNMSEGGIDYLEVFIPLPSDGFVLIEIGYNSETISEDDKAAIVDCLSSITLNASSIVAPTTEPDVAMVGNVATFGGLAVTLPEGYAAEISEDGIYAMYSNAAGTAMLNIFDMTGLDLGEDVDFAAVFDAAASASIADYEDATIESLGTEELSEGLVGYGYGIVVPDGAAEYILIQVYIPMPTGGFDLLQMGYDRNQVSQEEVDELAACLETVVLADSTGTAVAGGVTDVVESSDEADLGFTFSLPEGFSEIETDIWISDDGACMVMGLADVAAAGTPLDDLLAELATEFDAEVAGTSTIDAVNATVEYALLTTTQDGEDVYVIIATVPVNDGSLSLLAIICTAADAQTYDAALTEMMSSITVG